MKNIFDKRSFYDKMFRRSTGQFGQKDFGDYPNFRHLIFQGA